jgi:hypothetical protein
MPFRLPSRAAALVLALALAQAQAQAPQSAQTTDAALQAITDAAGVIFTGTVMAVRRPQSETASAGVVEIDFAVTDAIRGVSGSTYRLREWSGLWQANDEPFRPGQRFLMLLHPPNSAGLSSPVGGTDGAIPIHGSGNAALAVGAANALPRAARLQGTAQSARETAGAETIDLGWIATRVAVPVVYSTAMPVRPVHLPVMHAQASLSAQAQAEAQTQTEAQSVVQSGSQTELAPSTSAGLPAVLPADVRASSYTAVIEKLQTWESERSRNAAQ